MPGDRPITRYGRLLHGQKCFAKRGFREWPDDQLVLNMQVSIFRDRWDMGISIPRFAMVCDVRNLLQPLDSGNKEIQAQVLETRSLEI